MLIRYVKFDCKNDTILQNFSQEPSISLKYDCVLDALIIMLGAENWNAAKYMMVNQDVKFYTKDDLIFQSCSLNQSISSKYDCVLDALLIMRENCKSAYNFIMTYDGYLWWQFSYQRWPHPSKLQKVTINVFQVLLWSWLNSFLTKEWKMGIQLKNNISLWSMMSNLIPKTSQSSKTPVKNHLCTTNMTVFLVHLLSY